MKNMPSSPRIRPFYPPITPDIAMSDFSAQVLLLSIRGKIRRAKSFVRFSIIDEFGNFFIVEIAVGSKFQHPQL